MYCPFCSHQETKVIDSRLVAEGTQIRRRRECLGCHDRFTTFESFEVVLPRIVKSNGAREPFDVEKMRSGILRATEKRPVSDEDINTSINRIIIELRKTGEREFGSQALGELVMDELKKLDQVAYVRFASVYKNFRDLNEFQKEIADMQQED
ncbi:MAG: transcriptional regulator NrdR [Pseudomonadota bacterium]|nr:transcriptional regulator NrdR [Pseudomonadota bacterium]